MWKHEEKPTANRRESALQARRIGFAYPHSRKSLANLRFAQLRPPLTGQPALDLLVPSSGPFGQILSAPQRLPMIISPSHLILRLSEKKHFPHLVLLDELLPQRRRWGADRICPNGPDEGMSKTAKLDCESEDKQIRFLEPEGLRFAPIRGLFFFMCPHQVISLPNWISINTA